MQILKNLKKTGLCGLKVESLILQGLKTITDYLKVKKL